MKTYYQLIVSTVIAAALIFSLHGCNQNDGNDITMSQDDVVKAIKAENGSSIMSFTDLDNTADCWTVRDGSMLCTICIMPDGTDSKLCVPLRCPPVCDTPEAVAVDPVIWKDIWAQGQEIAKVAPQPQKEKVPEKLKAVKLKDDARAWAKKAGATVAVGFTAKDKDQKNIMLVTGLDKSGKRIAEKGYYISRM